MKHTYSNPRMTATIENWPSGSKRVTAFFQFAKQMRIVDGDDGRTYIAELSCYGHITIMRGDMKFNEESVHAGDPRHAELMALFA